MSTAGFSKPHHRVRWVTAQLLLAAMAIVQVGASGPRGIAAGRAAEAPANAPYNAEHPLLAYYYAWWEPEKLGWGPYQPLLTPFTGARAISDDEDLERSHIAEARAAGIDGFIVNRPVDLSQLLELTRGTDFRVTLQVDSNGDVESQVHEFYKHADDPGLITYQGRPALFFWRASARAADYWSGLREHVDPDHRALWLSDGDQFGVLSSDAWDGISPYAIAWSPNPAGQLPAWAAQARSVAPAKLFVPPVSPGCDDSVVRASTCIRDRGDGNYYQLSLKGALASNPQWAVVVSTWNEWMESTSIEPSVQYGDQYLRLTRQFADEFKSA